MNRKPKNHLRQQRGIAMIVALLALVLLAAIGMALMFMADTENSVNNNYKDSQKAYFAARAGAENVRLQLAGSGSLSAQALALSMPGQMLPTKGIIYVLNPTSASETISPTWASGAPTTISANPNLDDELCWEKYAGMVTTLIPSTGGPCGTNNQSNQLLPTTTTALAPFNTVTMTAVPGVNGGADALPYKWVRITNKQNFMGPLGKNVDGTTSNNGYQVCWDGQHQIPIAPGTTCDVLQPTTTPVWEVTSLAVTPPIGLNPGSRRMVQMEVALNPAVIPPAPIATQAPVHLQGSYVLNAYDSCSCTCTTTGSGNNTTTTCDQPHQSGCKNTAHAIFTENTVDTSGGAGTTTTLYGSDPTGSASVQNVDPWPGYLNIDNLINQYRPTAKPASYSPSCNGTQNFTATPPSYLNCGTQSNQTYGTYPTGLPTEPTSVDSVTEYIPGSVQLTSAANGSGILIVDGDLDINGGLNWYGLILVRGKVSFTGGAGASTNLYGAILAGDDVNATNQPQSDNFGGSINFQL